MTIYRLYYIEQEYIPSDYIDEDGYIDDYYDSYVDHDITVGYFSTKQAIRKYVDDEENLYLDDYDLIIEEIEVIN